MSGLYIVKQTAELLRDHIEVLTGDHSWCVV